MEANMLQDIATQAAKLFWAIQQDTFLSCFLLSFPLSAVFWVLKGPTIRLAYSMILGLACGFLVYGSKFINTVICSGVAYAMIRFLEPKVATKAVFLFTFVYLTAVQIYVTYFFYLQWTLEIEYPIMLITIKVTSLAWSILDHQKSKKDGEKISERRAQYAVPVPTVLEYFGFIFHFGALLVGPPFEFKDYIDFIRQDNIKGYPENKVRNACIVKGVRKLFKGLFFSVGFYLIGKYPTLYCTTDEYAARDLLYKVLYLQLAVSLTRWKYYSIWSIAEGSCILGGFGFKGFSKEDGSSVWGPVDTCHVIQVETAQSVKDAIDSWNIPTQVWMKEYVYLRFSDLYPKASRTIATIVTTLVGAIWHGVYPGYYLSFISSGFFTAGARELRRALRPYFVDQNNAGKYPLKYVYDLMGFVMSLGVLNYALAPFMVLDFKLGISAWANVYFIGHWLPLVITIAAVYAFPAKSAKKASAPNSKKTE